VEIEHGLAVDGLTRSTLIRGVAICAIRPLLEEAKESGEEKGYCEEADAFHVCQRVVWSRRGSRFGWLCGRHGCEAHPDSDEKDREDLSEVIPTGLRQTLSR